MIIVFEDFNTCRHVDVPSLQHATTRWHAEKWWDTDHVGVIVQPPNLVDVTITNVVLLVV